MNRPCPKIGLSALINIVFLWGFFLGGNVLARSSVWKVSDGERYFYLGGTVHLLEETDHPLPQEFQLAYADAQEVVFETDISAADSAQTQAEFLRAITSQDGRLLTDKLAPDIYRQLQEFLAHRGIPIAGFEGFEPWGVALMLSALEYQRIGLKTELGVDRYFDGLARRDDKQISELETLTEQMQFLSSLASVDPNHMIEQTLSDLAAISSTIDEIKDAWRTGNMRALFDISSVSSMQVEFPQVFDALLVQRNKNWLAKVDDLLADEDIEFVMVGVLHLPGEQGLLRLLQERGLEVKQFAP